jgi:hypothetical protein
MAEALFGPPPPFDPHSDPETVGNRWAKYVKRLEYYMTLHGVTTNPKRKAAIQYCMGEATEMIYETLKEDADRFEEVVSKLTAYFKPRTNVQYAVYKFRDARQDSGETVDKYVTRLRILAKDCEFQDVDNEILSQVIQCCESKKLRRWSLCEVTLTLKSFLDKGRAYELSEAQAKGMEGFKSEPKEEANRVQHKFGKQGKYKQTSQTSYNKQPSTGTCSSCGGKNHKSRSNCPAFGKTCHICEKPNHYARCCRSKVKPNIVLKVLQVVINTNRRRTTRHTVNQVIASRRIKSDVKTMIVSLIHRMILSLHSH